MAGIQDFVEFCDDFLGGGLLAAAGQGSPWVVTTTGSNTTTLLGGTNGEMTSTLADTEIQNVCVSFGDDLNFDIDSLIHAEFRVKTVAALDSATTLTFGMGSARNDAPASVAALAFFQCAGANTVTVETDDGTNDVAATATGTSLVATYKKFVIDFQNIVDVKFYIDGVRVGASTTFDMSNYSSGLQPIVQLQKTSDANTDSVTVDYVRVLSKRA